THWLYPNARKQKARLNEPGFLLEFVGVADGTRTHDDRNHNPYIFFLYFIWLDENIGICGSGRSLSDVAKFLIFQKNFPRSTHPDVAVMHHAGPNFSS
ncbi:hypothetical protein, partial [Burkholderia cenocepacia]|uniref:hypothetical protein n=1 Tax=Burkholderia cenocepacia TaxID=95486 RepID=UPI002AB74583